MWPKVVLFLLSSIYQNLGLSLHFKHYRRNRESHQASKNNNNTKLDSEHHYFDRFETGFRMTPPAQGGFLTKAYIAATIKGRLSDVT
jgi:hypothetical protein